jgi:2-polyprenyl-6-methoxyphenol hydroxylase-like FAD-dependent oxidoreductase
MLLARDGHDVTLLERDPAPVPDSRDEAWRDWTRSGVAQFRQPHYLQPRARHVLDSELPDVRDALVAAGALRFDTLATTPPTLGHIERRPGDERFVTLTARRPILERVVGLAAEAAPRLAVRRGVAATGLTTRGAADIPHVTGVRTGPGEELRADLVVDAMGRRSPVPAWLRASSAPPVHEEIEDSGFVYYTRYFRSRDGRRPVPRDRLLVPVGSVSILTLPGDDDTWSVTLFGSVSDRVLTRLRDLDCWTAIVSACPMQAHWLDGEPVTGILPMAGVLDRYRRLAVDGRPVVTGLVVVADAWACTNPSLGRGIALGLTHAVSLRDVIRTHLDNPRTLAEAWDHATETELTPWYRATVAVDRARLAEIEAICAGRERPRPASPAAALGAALIRAMPHDADIFRAFMEIAGCLVLPNVVFARPGFTERVLEIANRHELAAPLGPTREQLLQLVR